jgi:alkanesulfonate monooxygenase SsuD/methylene tetrahydromethanopterin reductase-like flavin-dependent oxidoreductase (luciferase family)
MRFGLFCLMPQRDRNRTVQQIADDAIEQARLAEALDFETVWFAEHHFSNYSVIPSPLMMAAYCAGRTSRIKLGTGVLVLPLYDPIRLVEEIAFVDQISGGRLQLGLGSGYQDYEFKHFGRNLSQSQAMFLEILDIIEAAFLSGEIAFNGAHFAIDRAALGLRPKQTPMPPVYVAGLMQNTEVQARLARSGHTPFLPQHHRPAAALASARQNIEDIWRSVDRPNQMRLAIQRFAFVTRDRNEAREAAENIRYTLRLALGLRFNTAKLDGAVLREGPVANEPTLEEILEHAPIGDPARVAEVLADDIRILRPNHLSLMMQFGSLPQPLATKSLQLLGSDVLPILEKELGDLFTTDSNNAKRHS